MKPSARSCSYAASTVLRDIPSSCASRRVGGSLVPSPRPLSIMALSARVSCACRGPSPSSSRYIGRSARDWPHSNRMNWPLIVPLSPILMEPIPLEPQDTPMATLIAPAGCESPALSARAPWTAIAGVGGALVDLAVAAAYWSQFHVEAIRIPQGIAAWVIGRGAFDGGAATALFGLLLYCGLVCAACVLYRAAARRWDVLARQPVLCGALYGVLAYGAIFWVIAP